MERVKVFIVYLLILVIIGLIGYLIYFVINFSSPSETESHDKKASVTNDVSDSCTLDSSIEEYNKILDGNSSLNLCDGLNRIVLSDVTMEGEKQSLEILYQNGKSSNDSGYMKFNGFKILSKVSSIYGSTLIVFDNKLFVIERNDEYVNILAYTKDGNNVFNLKDTLEASNISDPAFVELAKSGYSNTVLDYNHIDKDSVRLGSDSITFNSDSKTACQAGSFKGSTYVIKFTGNTFGNPVYTQGVTCQ